ncbi:MAG: HDOD domain-containing protein [Bdellovibrionota bacterium]
MKDEGNVILEIDLLNLYRDFLLPLTPNKAVSDLLDVIMTGGETTQDFAGAVEKDAEISEWVKVSSQRIVKNARSSSTMEYKVSVLGLNRVRNMLVGRHIERAIVPENKTLLALMIQEREKNKDPSKKPKDASATAPEEEEQKSIPDFLAFEKYLPYSIRAERAAIELKYSFPGQGFAAGVLFDYVRAFLANLDIEAKVQEQRFKKPERFVEELFVDGLRCAIAANEISNFVQIRYQKNIFFSSIVRNIGKALLLAYDPEGYERVGATYREAVKAGVPIKSYEAEEDEFDLDHAQVTALYIGRVPCFRGLEKSIDYHHNPRLLKSRDREQYALSSVLRLAGLLVTAYQDRRLKEMDISRLPDRKIVESEVFQALKLTSVEWEKIKTNYALSLLKLGL